MKRSVSLALLALALAACGNPYALDLNSINFDAKQENGVIQFTDPKLYRREALINERRAERAYLRNLLEATEDDGFTIEPEIVRELELIQAFSAAVGVRYDPAAAAEFERATEDVEQARADAARDRELNDIRREIELTRLEMELAQVKRDAELLETQLAEQDEPSGTTSTTSAQPPAKPPAPKFDVAAPDATKLINDIDKLRQKLESRLSADVKPPKAASGAASPIDTFNDLSAYRDVLKSAINAASLDELHDMDGNSLFRVQLKATVLPGGADYRDTLGMLRLQIGGPALEPGSQAMRDLYLAWLLHVNRGLNLAPDPGLTLPARRIRTSNALLTLGDASQLFVVTLLEVPKQGVSAAAGAAACGGVQPTERRPADCWYVRVAAPPLHSGWSFAETLDYTTQFPNAMSGLLQGAAKSVATAKDFENQDIDRARLKLDATCGRFVVPEGQQAPRLARTDKPDRIGQTPDEALVIARSVRAWWPYLVTVVGSLSEFDFGPHDPERAIGQQLTQSLGEIRQVQTAASAFLGAVAAGNPDCARQLVDVGGVITPPVFEAFLQQFESRVTVYDVAPTERVQRVSTVARAADAVTLAAALAGQLPSPGIGATGNFAYSRTATGKADAIERAPLVVGFAEPGQQGSADHGYPAFGWLLGPQVSVDPEAQALVLSQRVKPYYLYADLSLPGWWPYFTLQASTAWAPAWRTAQEGATANLTEPVLSRALKVPMNHNPADMDGLTTLLLGAMTGQGIAYPTISSIEPRALSACAGDIQFQIRGENIWRASLVHVGGLAVESDQISVLPDMRGVLVKIKAQDIPRIDPGPNLVTVWTKDGPAAYSISFEDRRKADGTCQAIKAPPPALQGPVISAVTPDTFSVCDPQPVFTVVGQNLRGAQSAMLGTIAAEAPTELAPGDGTALEIKVQNPDGSQKIASGQTVLSLAVRTVRGVATAQVEVAHVPCQ